MRRILITNDDGVGRRGLNVLADVASALFDEVHVVAPASEMSGVSHAITLTRPLRMREHANGHHSVNGTPADCVITALGTIFEDEPPDLVLSGINRGPNLGNDVFYSGTVAGAREGFIRGIPSVAFSMTGPKEYPYEAAAPAVKALLEKWVADPPPATAFLNVNIPTPDTSEAPGYAGVPGIRGVQVTRLGERVYSDEIITRADPRGTSYFWIGGAYPRMTHTPGTDCGAILDGYISVTPLSLDLTHHDVVTSLSHWSTKSTE